MEYPTFRKEYLDFTSLLISRLDAVYDDGSLSPSNKQLQFAEIGKQYEMNLNSLIA